MVILMSYRHLLSTVTITISIEFYLDIKKNSFVVQCYRTNISFESGISPFLRIIIKTTFLLQFLLAERWLSNCWKPTLLNLIYRCGNVSHHMILIDRWQCFTLGVCLVSGVLSLLLVLSYITHRLRINHFFYKSNCISFFDICYNEFIYL